MTVTKTHKVDLAGLFRQEKCLAPLALFLLLLCGQAQAQLSERFGDYELHYSVVNTTFIEPAVAAQYGLARGSRRAIINLSLREHLDDGSTVARQMSLEGRSWDLMQSQVNFDFIEVREGPALYYIGEFKFINREWRFFELNFTPEGSDEALSFEFKQQMYIND
ncbi:hypothetical protein NOR53_3693 [gamma proteobacterium NOR5-3]|nr:hypothetical protein NOR53_3693 [gamma proteobacterium NOR5-3]